jgi:hypothetical protein
MELLIALHKLRIGNLLHVCTSYIESKLKRIKIDNQNIVLRCSFILFL